MLKLGEKAIYEFSRGFDIRGAKCSASGKKLYITNLGNIIITASDISDETAERYVYSYSEYKIKLSAHLSEQEIIVSEKGMPFRVISSNSERESFVDFELRMDIDDFSYICRNQREFIFEIDENQSLFVIDEEKIFSGGINRDHEKFVFAGGKNRFEIYYDDIERFMIEGNMMTLKGYFHMERESIIARTVQIFNNNIKRIPPAGFEEMISENPKIGNMPQESKIVFGRITGSAGGFDYKSSNVLVVRYDNKFIIINKKTKRTISSFDIHKSGIIRNGNETIVYDGENIFRLYMNDKNIEVTAIDDAPEINTNDIAITRTGNPVFIETDGKNIYVKKDRKRDILTISEMYVSDINIINDDSFSKYGYKRTKIIFGNEYIEIYLKKDMIDSLVREIFVYSKEKEIKKADIHEIYRNWSKSVNDIVIYNFFARLYAIRNDIVETMKSGNITDEIRINIINELYENITSLKEDIDALTVYMPDFVKAPAIDIAGRLTVIESPAYRYIDEIFSDIGYTIKDELRDIEIIIGNLSFVISPEERRRHIFRMLKENESDRLKLFMNKALNKLEHIVCRMYPYYIRNTEERLYAIFRLIEKEYKNYDSEKVREKLFRSITEMYAFRQGRYSMDSDIRRKDIIEELQINAYSEKGVSSFEWFFMGGNDYER